jgi:hypothetical protein
MKARRRDPRELPAYRLPEAAHYLRIPVTTLRAWVLGQDYDTAAGRHRHFAPVIRLPSQTPPRLSFINLVEAHVLDAIRRQHEIPLQKVRQALSYLRKIIPSSAYPLADQHFETDSSHPVATARRRTGSGIGAPSTSNASLGPARASARWRSVGSAPSAPSRDRLGDVADPDQALPHVLGPVLADSRSGRRGRSSGDNTTRPPPGCARLGSWPRRRHPRPTLWA